MDQRIIDGIHHIAINFGLFAFHDQIEVTDRMRVGNALQPGPDRFECVRRRTEAQGEQQSNSV